MTDLENHRPTEGGSYTFDKNGKFLGKEGGTFAPTDPKHEDNARPAPPPADTKKGPTK